MEQQLVLEKEIQENTLTRYDDANYSDAYNILMNASRDISDIASIKNMEKSFESYKNQHPENKEMRVQMDNVLGMANTLMLRLDKAKTHFMDSGAMEKLEETFMLAQKYGRFNLVKEFLEYGANTGDKRFSMDGEEYKRFLKTKAIHHMPLYREGNKFTIDEKDLEAIMAEYSNINGKDFDRKKLVQDVLSDLESKGNLNTPKKLYLANYCDDLVSLHKNWKDFEAKEKGIRKHTDLLIEDYCQEKNLDFIKKIQDGDNDDFFPISSNLYLVEDKDAGKKIVLKENLRLYVDFSRSDGYNMEREIYEWINTKKNDSNKKAADNIVTYLGSSDIGGIEIIRMDYFDGERLSEYTDKNDTTKKGVLPLEESVKIVRKVADTMNYLHDIDIIYSDIKDTNILYDRKTGNVRLLDFGMARLFYKVTDDTKGQSLLSTPKYVPPEMGTRFTFSKKSDVFQLGVLFYEMVTGHHPFADSDSGFKEGEGYRESEIMKYSLANIVNELELRYDALYRNPKILPLIKDSLEKDPEKRIDMKEFYSRIKDIEEDSYGKIRGK